jgi:hypothetical protein
MLSLTLIVQAFALARRRLRSGAVPEAPIMAGRA